MHPGYLYILSNPSLLPDVFKIGLSKGTAKTRARQLSRSAAIPTNFEVKHEFPVKNVVTAERRVHLLLDAHRVNPSKEFFRLDLQFALETCQAIVDYEMEDDTISPYIGLSQRLSAAHYYPDSSLNSKKLIGLMIGATTNNTLFDRIFKVRRGVADGFLTAAQVSAYFEVGKPAASRTMRRLASHGAAMSCRKLDEPPMNAIFEFIRYHKGHLAWRFSNEFREHFSNPKI